MRGREKMAKAALRCPKCCRASYSKDGLRSSLSRGDIQRYTCKVCGYRFSAPPNAAQSKQEKEFEAGCSNFYEPSMHATDSQICAQTVKNLDHATETKTVAGEEKTLQEIKGKILQYAIYLEDKGKPQSTIHTYVGALNTLIGKGANILSPSSVEHVIAKQQTWSMRAKKNYVDWYARFAKYMHYDWEKPVYKAPDAIPFIPTEKEIDDLIANSPKKLSIALQIAKETASRIGETVRIKWTDIDFERGTIAINEPEKGSNSGTYHVSSELISRIATLPKKSIRIFGSGVAITDSLTNTLITTRRRLSHSFNNPRLLKIHSHTFRHWAITMYAHKVKDPFLVQIFARHKDMKCTSKYIHYEKVIFQSGNKDEWTVRVAKTVQDAVEFVQVGFEYVTDMKDNDDQMVKIFRKRK